MQHAGIGNKSIKKKAAELAKYGRNGDTILAHISPAESALLSVGGKTKNPHTGLDEHFAFMPLLIGAALGALTNRKNPLKGALLGAAMGGIGQGISGAFAGAFPETAASMGIGAAADAAGVAGAAGGAGAAAIPEAMYAPGAVTSSALAAPAVAAGTPAVAAAASGGIGQGIVDYFSSPMGIMTGIGAAGSVLSPTYEEPTKDQKDEDYVETDFQPRHSIFDDADYDSSRQGRSGYRYAKGGGIGKYADGGDVPYQEPTDVGTAGKAAFPTADNVHSYGTRGEFDFFPSPVKQPSADSAAARAAAGNFSSAKIAGVDKNAIYLSDGRTLKLSNGAVNPGRYFAAGDTFSNTVGQRVINRGGMPAGITTKSTYEDLLRALAPGYFASGGATAGIGGGKDDTIPAMLSDGEHVLTADEVSDLGDGSNAEGQRVVYKMRDAIRKHKNTTTKKKGGIGHRPKAKKPSEYMRAAGV